MFLIFLSLTRPVVVTRWKNISYSPKLNSKSCETRDLKTKSFLEPKINVIKNKTKIPLQILNYRFQLTVE